MKSILKKLASIGIVLYIAQAMVGVYLGVQVGIKVANAMEMARNN